MQYNKFVNILGRPIPQRWLPGRFLLKYFREVSTMVRKTEVAFVPNLRGGEGTVESDIPRSGSPAGIYPQDVPLFPGSGAYGPVPHRSAIRVSTHSPARGLTDQPTHVKTLKEVSTHSPARGLTPPNPICR